MGVERYYKILVVGGALLNSGCGGGPGIKTTTADAKSSKPPAVEATKATSKPTPPSARKTALLSPAIEKRFVQTLRSVTFPQTLCSVGFTQTLCSAGFPQILCGVRFAQTWHKTLRGIGFPQPCVA